MLAKEALEQIDQHLKEVNRLAFIMSADCYADQRDIIDDLTGAVNEIEQGIMPVLRALFQT